MRGPPQVAGAPNAAFPSPPLTRALVGTSESLLGPVRQLRQGSKTSCQGRTIASECSSSRVMTLVRGWKQVTSLQSSSSPCLQCPDAQTGPSPQRGEQQTFVGPRGIQSPQQQEEGLGLVLEALEEGLHSIPRAPLTAQHTLQVQEEFRRWAPYQGLDQQLRGTILALGNGGLHWCCTDTQEEENKYEEESYKLVKPRHGQFLKITPKASSLLEDVCRFY